MAQFYDVQGGYTPDDLLPGIQHFESGGRPYAIGPMTKRGEQALGLYQILPSTARDFGVSREELFDPKKNEGVARQYLDQLLRRYNGNAYMALAAYNAGPNNIDKGIFPPETQKYVHDVLGYTQGYGAAKQSGQRIRQQRAQAASDPMQAQLNAIQQELKNWDAQYNTPQAPPAAPQPPPMNDQQFLGNVLLNSMFGRYGGQMSGDKFAGEAPLTQIQPGPMSRLFSSTVGKI